MSTQCHILLFVFALFSATIVEACNKSIIVETNDSNKSVDGFVIAQWNIGHFDFGIHQNSTINPSSFDKQYQKYKDMLSSIDADLLAVCEYSAIFGTNDNGEQESLSTLFGNYPYFFEGHQAGYACNALFCKDMLENIESHSFDSVNTGYYYLSADLTLCDITVKVVSTHIAFTGSNDDFALSQIKELIAKYSDFEYVVIFGDWNIRDINNYSLFIDSGFTLANHGDFGDFETISRKKSPNAHNYAQDNILVKGLVISDVKVISQDLSDHYPIIACITLGEGYF